MKIISADTGISIRSLNDEFIKLKKMMQRQIKEVKKPSNISREKERLILKAFISLGEDYTQLIIEKVSPNDFISIDEKNLFIKLSEIYQNYGYLNYYDLYKWLTESLNNQCYVDDVLGEREGKQLTEILQYAQYNHKVEIYNIALKVINYLIEVD